MGVVWTLGWPAVGPAARAGVEIDPALPHYKPVQGVSGTIKSVGSDTMNNLMALWCEGFKEFYPNVQVEIEGKGSSAAPPALIAGSANFGPMSRELKSEEIDAFETKYGYKPVSLPTSLDMLAVYLHKDNPTPGLTLAQVDALFGRHRRAGYPNDVRHWSDLGLTDPTWALQPISLYGRNSASGTYTYLKEAALFGGDFKDSVKEQPGSSAVIQGVASDRTALGYSGIGYRTADVRAVPLAGPDGVFRAAEPENALNGTYPLSRFLLVVVNHAPGKPLDPLRREFLRFVFSKDGQENVIKDGYLPVTAALARQSLELVEIKPDF
ncbi:MAG: PstS family phosphate ABC transporter substrate-binding protein [Planctomycetia bacterium]